MRDEEVSFPLGPIGALKRPQYEPRAYLAFKDLAAEQLFRMERWRHHNRYLHGAGVICGLQVVPAQKPGRPWAVSVCPGYAIGCCGDEIEVYSPVVLDIRDHVWNWPADSISRVPSAYVAIRFAEKVAKPVPATPPACGCDETVYEDSRILDTYKVDVLWLLPRAIRQSVDICARNLINCPDCRDGVHVMLARLTLPASESDPITSAHIDNLSHRHLLATTTMAQQQLIECCCGK